MAHPLLTRAEMGRDGVLIALEADTLEMRIKALEATLNSTKQFQEELKRELQRLKTN